MAPMNPDESLELLRLLCDAHGVSGYEDEVRALVDGWVRPCADEVVVDALGNLMALRQYPVDCAPLIQLQAKNCLPGAGPGQGPRPAHSGAILRLAYSSECTARYRTC